MSPDEFRRIGHRLIDWVADYRERVARLPVRSPVTPGAIRAQLPEQPPEEPQPVDWLFEDLERILLPGLSHWQHPSFFGYFPSNAELSSVLGDYLSTGLGVLGLSWQSSPALSELEQLTTDWVRQMVGLTPAWTGVIQDTASTSTLVALVCARERGLRVLGDEGASAGRPLVVYRSAQSHSSVDKAIFLAGFGRANLRAIPVDERYALRADALAEAVERDLERGLQPCAVVATTGTTTSTALDPIGAIARVAQQHGLWLHVDAAMGGSAMILPECRWMWSGIEAADSLVINAHKWLGAVFDCSLYFVRDPQQLTEVMSTNPSYLRSGADTEVANLRNWGIPLGRRFRALKLWWLIRDQGVTGLQRRLRRDLENARWLQTEVQATPGWRVLAPVPLQTVCVRHEPPGLAGEALDRHTLTWCEQLNASGLAYLTPAQLDGRWMVRVSVGGLDTEREHVAALWSRMRESVAVSANTGRLGGVHRA